MESAPKVEGEVKLPAAAAGGGQLPPLVREGQSQLDHLQHVHVAPARKTKVPRHNAHKCT